MYKRQDKNIKALICARQGSKGLPGKNIKAFAGKPLIAHSIEIANAIPIINQVVVSTDGPDIAKTARSYGAEVPFSRPLHLAQDTSPEWLVWRNAIEYFVSVDEILDCLVILPPTAPLRNVTDVIGAIDKFFENDCDGVICVNDAYRNPEFNMVRKTVGGYCELAIIPDQTISRRQDAAEYFDVNTVCYVMCPNHVMSCQAMLGGRLIPHIVPAERAVDIDTEFDFVWAEFLYERNLRK